MAGPSLPPKIPHQYLASKFPQGKDPTEASPVAKTAPITEWGKATIVLLVGSSTAGKTTVCNQVLEKSDPSVLPWDITGTDIERDGIINQQMDDHLMGFIKKDEEYKAWFDGVRPDYSQDRDVFQAILGDKITELPPGLKEEFEEHFKSFTPTLRGSELEKAIFDATFTRAMENSRRGIPTIIDIAPAHDKNIIEIFERFLREREKPFSCPTMTIQTHLAIPKLLERMIHRNATQPDKRDGLFPAQQYASMYGSTQSDDHLGELKREDVEKFIANFRKEAEADQIEKLMSDLGFSEGVDVINIGPKHLSDLLVNTETVESSADIAMDIVKRSTVNSEIPTRRHPVFRDVIPPPDKILPDE